VIEGSTVACPHCAGAGMVRSTSSIALHVLRALEDALIRNSSYDIVVKTRTAVALYILNQKRPNLHDLEKRFGASLTIAADDALSGTNYYALERGEPAAGAKQAPSSRPEESPSAALADGFFEETAGIEEGSPDSDARDEALETGANRRESEIEAEGRQKRRRRRRRGRGGDRETSGIAANAPQPPDDALEAMVRIEGLHSSVGLDSDAETGRIALANELGENHQETDLRSRREGRRPRKAPELPDAGPTDAAPLEFALVSEPEPSEEGDGTETGERRSPVRRARRGRRVPREPRAPQGGEAALPANAASVFAASDVQDWFQASDIPPQGNEGEVTASPGKVETDPTEAPQSALVSGRDEIPSRAADESSQSEALDPARPKRSGWWQRAKASART
jgi:ribonuclease E